MSVRHAIRPHLLTERLSVRLRQSTRAAHGAAETSMALEVHLEGRAAYGALLAALEGFYRPLESALSDAVDRHPRLVSPDLVARGRAELLRDDLDALEVGVSRDEARESQLPALGSAARGLGCLYVLEGAALGGRIITAMARTRLGPDVPVAFFCGADGADSGRSWHSFQRILDEFGAGAPLPVVDEVVAGAIDTFSTLTAWLDSQLGPA